MCAPGLALAQAMFGSILLEAGELDAALEHLESARSLDPASMSALPNLARGYVYAGRTDEALALLRVEPAPSLFTQMSIARYDTWRGRRTDSQWQIPEALPDVFRRHAELSRVLHRTGTLSPAQVAELIDVVDVAGSRLKAALAQFATEYLAVAGDHERALDVLAIAVGAGIQDHLWLERCPVLEPLRALPRFRELAAVVAKRAADVLGAIHAPLMS
jgi:serine/threonine-protein kinase